MADPKRIIAVCTTKIQSQDRISFIEGLYKRLDKNRYKIIVFNSPSEFEINSPGDTSAKATYDIINYARIDCLLIDKDYFKSEDVFNAIVERAKENNVPVIAVNGEVEGCYNIHPDYNSAYEKLIAHLITVHNYRDFFFIGGIQGEPESERRLEIFRQTLNKYGVDFSDQRIAYGQYYEFPVYSIFNELYQNNKLPQVFVCANDTMAFAVYQKAQECGINIPDDIAVTGFDGIYYSQFLQPPLSTCRMNDESLLSTVEKIIEGICCNALSPGCFYSSCTTIAKGSCGCNTEKSYLSNEVIIHKFRDVERSSFFEDQVYDVIEKAVDFDSRSNIYEMLINCSIPASSVCIKGDYSSTLDNLMESGNGFSDKFYVLKSANNTDDLNVHLRMFPLADMVPYFDEWMNDDTLYMVTAICAGDSICGHYAVKTRLVEDKIHRFNRTGRAINLIMTEALSRYKQRNITNDNANALNINPISELPNLKSLTSWFESFSAVPANHEKSIMISLYWMPKYKELYEQYGNERNRMVAYVGEILKIANAHNSFVSQIAEDEFIVVNYVDNGSEISSTIDNATNVFYGFCENYTYEKKQQYGENFGLEVSCGCTCIYNGWSDSIDMASLIKLARTEMFANRLKYSGGNATAKDSRSTREDCNALVLLISKNKFIYHYQPIIDIRSRSIYAYEALMRTDSEINLSPLEILATADSYKRLYEIERATIFNVMKQYSESSEELFRNRKVFINSIPGHFLNSKDREEVVAKYSNYLDSFVFEITETYEASDEEIITMKSMCTELHIPIAIDDYGSGCSNIVNLLRYDPQIIKVDRYLITDIDKDANKQMFMKGTLDFAKANNVKVLAEGVETQEEFRAVIALGVDYVQGYYTGRPAPIPLAEIPDFLISDIESVDR